MNELLAFITENFWLILMILAMFMTKRQVYAFCILAMLTTIGMQPIIFIVIVVFSLMIPALEES